MRPLEVLLGGLHHSSVEVEIFCTFQGNAAFRLCQLGGSGSTPFVGNLVPHELYLSEVAGLD